MWQSKDGKVMNHVLVHTISNLLHAYSKLHTVSYHIAYCKLSHVFSDLERKKLKNFRDNFDLPLQYNYFHTLFQTFYLNLFVIIITSSTILLFLGRLLVAQWCFSGWINHVILLIIHLLIIILPKLIKSAKKYDNN